MCKRAPQLGACVLLLLLAAVAATPATARESRPTVLRAFGADPGAPTERYYVALRAPDGEKLTEIFHALHAAGARNIHAFMPDLIVCDVPVNVSAGAVVAGPDVVVAHAAEADRLTNLGLSTRPAAIEHAFETLRTRRAGEPSAPDTPAVVPGIAERCEVRRHSIEAIEASARAAARVRTVLAPSFSAADEPRLLHQESELLTGTILVNIVLPESDLTWWYTEDWSQELIDQVHLGVYFAMQLFMDEFQNADINVIYRYYDQVLIKTEPIYSPPSEDAFWITLCMNALGYETAESQVVSAVHRFNDDGRRRHGVDWAVTMFVALSERKARISDPRFADAGRLVTWGYLGGPYFVTPFPVDWMTGSYGVQQVVRHDVGHMFWALEEDVNGDGCEERSGYLDVKNGNRVTEYTELGGRRGCETGLRPIPCTMNKTDALDIGWDPGGCAYTQRMWGVSDDNENGVPDALDAAPAIEFFGADVETVTTPVSHLDVRVRALAVPNRNPQQPPDLRRDYAPLIKDINVTIGGMTSYIVEPGDIGSNGSMAEFRVNLPPLIPGALDITVRARNEFFATSPPRTKRYHYVHLKYLGFQRTQPDEGVRLTWDMVGELFDARLALHRRNEATAEEITVIPDVVPAGPTVNHVTPFDVLDDSTVPGVDYTYWVTGTIDLPNSAGSIHKVVSSRPVRARGALARNVTPASPVSHLAPNPFREITWLSIDVRHAPARAPGGGGTIDDDSRIPVIVSVYDVLGHRIRDIYRRYTVDDVVTVSWDGTDARGRRVPAGLYFVSVHVGSARETRKVVLLR